MDDDAFRIVLLTEAYAPDAGHAGLADVAGSEVAAGNGYATGGQAPLRHGWVQDGATVRFDADDPQWAEASFSACTP
jgi:hypothetical protein